MSAVLGKAYTKKEIEEMSFDKLLKAFRWASLVDWDNNGHRGAEKECVLIVQELYRRYNTKAPIPTPDMIKEWLEE